MMEYAARVRRTAAPPLTRWMEAAARARAEGRDVIVLAQAMVDYRPPEIFGEALQAALAAREAQLHRYAPDAGLPELRVALTHYLERAFGVTADPQREILVTPGANHAAYTALSVLLEPGDEALLVSPWYFNHAMSVELLGARVRTVTARTGEGFVPDPQALAEAWTPRTRVLVLVNPNNPTGACYPRAWLESLARLLAEDPRWDTVWLLSDQTYQELYFTAQAPPSPAAHPALRARTVTVGSFSKCFGLAGWRLGFLCAPPGFVDQALKIQDSSVICAPRAAQWALARTLAESAQLAPYLAEKRTRLRRRRDALLAPLRAVLGEGLAIPGGACFAWLDLPAGMSGEACAERLLREQDLVLVPGTPFGPDCGGAVRISFGTEGVERLAEAGRRIAGLLAS